MPKKAKVQDNGDFCCISIGNNNYIIRIEDKNEIGSALAKNRYRSLPEDVRKGVIDKVKEQKHTENTMLFFKYLYDPTCSYSMHVDEYLGIIHGKSFYTHKKYNPRKKKEIKA